ncbi:unnamed protein product [Coffea canephora]|uniref:J domain-containing protein n=1 Tax=Coffea canephora TaxID=49390 RepID=A0A068VDC3_COFCA|nr:unnamed protein product [Coffea canephora]
MEVLRHRNMGICIPSLLSPGSTNTSSIPNSFSSATNKWAERLFADFQFLLSTIVTADHSDDNSATATLTPPFTIPTLAPTERSVKMPIDFYRILGIEAHFLGDGIRRAYEAKVSRPPHYGYSQDALVSRRMILQVACQTLANASSQREYNQGLADDEFGTIITQVPWDKVNFPFIYQTKFFTQKLLDEIAFQKVIFRLS